MNQQRRSLLNRISFINPVTRTERVPISLRAACARTYISRERRSRCRCSSFVCLAPKRIRRYLVRSSHDFLRCWGSGAAASPLHRSSTRLPLRRVLPPSLLYSGTAETSLTEKEYTYGPVSELRRRRRTLHLLPFSYIPIYTRAVRCYNPPDHRCTPNTPALWREREPNRRRNAIRKPHAQRLASSCRLAFSRELVGITCRS